MATRHFVCVCVCLIVRVCACCVRVTVHQSIHHHLELACFWSWPVSGTGFFFVANHTGDDPRRRHCASISNPTAMRAELAKAGPHYHVILGSSLSPRWRRET